MRAKREYFGVRSGWFGRRQLFEFVDEKEYEKFIDRELEEERTHHIRVIRNCLARVKTLFLKCILAAYLY